MVSKTTADNVGTLKVHSIPVMQSVKFRSTSFERLLRLCASDMVAHAAASPSCCEFSRLKLVPNGPPTLRTPNQLQGIPGLTGNKLLRVQESFIMLERCIQYFQLTISAGGHGHLEQPKSAISWDGPIFQQFVSQNACSCILCRSTDTAVTDTNF